jgi:ABC-type bacteriocin/lantibiotic exporter with double-glycine peptidase domain
MNVPLIKQHYKKGCGAAVLSMVFKYFRDNISEKEIVKELGGFKSYGLKTTDLARFAKQKDTSWSV